MVSELRMLSFDHVLGVKLLESPDPSGLLCPGPCSARAGVGCDGQALEEEVWGLSETGALL